MSLEMSRSLVEAAFLTIEAILACAYSRYTAVFPRKSSIASKLNLRTADRNSAIVKVGIICPFPPNFTCLGKFSEIFLTQASSVAGFSYIID